MRGIKNKGSILIAFFTIALVMFQETPAQEKRATRPDAQRSRTTASAPDIHYSVSMSKPWTHLLEVEMRVRWPQMPAALELKMPVWTPGSYLIREYARHVQDFSVKDAAGKDLPWSKVNKNTWQIAAGGAREIVTMYKVYSNELTVRTNELNADHAFWNNAALLMFPKDQLAAPSTVTVNPYRGWKVATGLPEVPGRANTFRAENFDILYDSPFEVSNFREITFRVQNKPHRIVVTGEGNYDLKKMAEDAARIAEEGFKIFGELPFDDYLYIVNVRPGVRSNGLEHLNSTALIFNALGFKPNSSYQNFLALVAHEYFHLWNVKRIRPDTLGPFDYENENYTKLLWFAEGATAYYEGVLLRRAGLITEEELLRSKAKLIAQLQARPGRFETSLEEASFDAWIKYYRQDENAVNNQISYYDKGEIVNMMLDITIRTASDGAKSLDDVMRHLYNEFYKKDRNFTPEDLQRAAELAAGRSLADFFDKYVRGEAEIEYDAILRGIGLRLDANNENSNKAYLGADLVEESGKLTVKAVPADTPAYTQGLNAGDHIVAVEGYRASLTFLQSYIGERKPNDKITLSVFRHDRLREILLTLGVNPRSEYAFARVDEPTETQQRLYRDYMNADLASLAAAGS